MKIPPIRNDRLISTPNIADTVTPNSAAATTTATTIPAIPITPANTTARIVAPMEATSAMTNAIPNPISSSLIVLSRMMRTNASIAIPSMDVQLQFPAAVGRDDYRI